MRSAESIIYSDIEKYHRVLGYYKYLENKPIDLHQSFIDKNLEVFLRPPDNYVRRFRYQLGPSEVSSEKQIVFRAEKPEISLTFSLFSEGVHSLSVLRELRAAELGRWCQLIEDSIEDFERGGDDDLASILWRFPFRNIRTKIANGLTDLASGVKQDFINDPSTWHGRDSEWTLPSAENLQRHTEASQPLGAQWLQESISRLSNRECIDESQSSIRLQDSEILAISEELSGFDENQVDFNFLNLCFTCFRDPESIQNKLLIDSFYQCIDSILNRFQPSLILYLLEKIENSNLSENLLVETKDKLSQSLMKPENEHQLLSSLMDGERAVLTRRLFPYLSATQIPNIIRFLIEQNDKDAIVLFLKDVLKLHSDFDKLIFSLGWMTLVKILPLFRQLDWPSKYEFLFRCLKSPHSELVKMASHYVAGMKVNSREAIDIYAKSSDETKEIWQRALLEAKPEQKWKKFVSEICESSQWLKAENHLIRNRLALGWIQCLIKYEGENAISILSPLVLKRKYVFFPQFPEAREIILNSLLDSQVLKKSNHLNRLIQNEAKLRFQSKELKVRLSLRGLKNE